MTTETDIEIPRGKLGGRSRGSTKPHPRMSQHDLDRFPVVTDIQLRRILRLSPAEYRAFQSAGKLPTSSAPGLYRSCDVRNWITGLPAAK